MHRAAAEALAVLVGKQDVQSERAHHLHAAGDLEAACAALTDGLAWSHRVGDAEARRLRSTTLETWARAGDLAHYEARALAEQAHIHATERDPEAARAAIERARIVEASAEAPSAWLAFRAAQVATARGEVDDARGEAERALELARARGLDDVVVQALGHLALDAYRRRDLESARRQFEEVVSLARSLGDGVTEAKALVHLGNLAPTESLDVLERAVATAQAAGAVLVELSARQVHADALFELGRRAEAMAELGEVNTHARARGARQHASVVAIQLACWQLWEGAVTEAAKALGQAKEQGASEGSRVERCMVAALEAAIAAAEGDEEAARSALDQLATARGDLDVPDLRKVLAWGRAKADADLAARFATALD